MTLEVYLYMFIDNFYISAKYVASIKAVTQQSELSTL